MGMTHHLVIGAALTKEEFAINLLAQSALHFKEISGFKHFAVSISYDTLFATHTGVGDVQAQVY